uniref:Helicase ATP-binding domain-containing protein n=1 Tax=viral metagenome TaxID=1070528 RepID=A0A6C0LQX1_9ZZZZ
MTVFNKKITQFGYILLKKQFSDNEIIQIKNDLTIKPFKMGNYKKFSKQDDNFSIYLENDDYICVPKYYGLNKFGKPDINKLELHHLPKTNIDYIGKLRPNQEIIVNKIINGFDEKNGGILIAGCGSGKTNMAIYIASYYKLKTLFIVHKKFLKNQVIDRIKSVTNITNVGIIQGNKIDIDKPFVVGMVQSLCKMKYDPKIFKDFGLIIIDEVHHMGAKNFSKAYQVMSAKYMLGISAERTRNDGTYKLINWYMGPILHMEEQKPNNMVIVKKFNYKTSNTERIKYIENKYTNEPNRAKMINNLILIKKRNRFILKIIEELHAQGKNILCLTSRLRQVKKFYKLLNENLYIRGNIGKYIGSMSENELKQSATKQIIIGTYEMAQEGLDIDNLNVVILCTPKSSIKQSVGRILRKEIYEEHPLVIDFNDFENKTFKRQSIKRDIYYVKQHYHIQKFNVSDFKNLNYNDWDDEKFIRDAICKQKDQIENKIQQKNDDELGKIEFLSD